MIAGQLTIFDELAAVAPPAVPAPVRDVMGHVMASQYHGHQNVVAALVAGWRPGDKDGRIPSSQTGGGQVRCTLDDSDEWLHVSYHRLGMQGRTFRVADEPWAEVYLSVPAMATWADHLPSSITVPAANCVRPPVVNASWNALNRIVITALDMTPTECSEAEQRRRLDFHAAGLHCPACGTNDYPHNDTKDITS